MHTGGLLSLAELADCNGWTLPDVQGCDMKTPLKDLKAHAILANCATLFIDGSCSKLALRGCIRVLRDTLAEQPREEVRSAIMNNARTVYEAVKGLLAFEPEEEDFNWGPLIHPMFDSVQDALPGRHLSMEQIASREGSILELLQWVNGSDSYDPGVYEYVLTKDRQAASDMRWRAMTMNLLRPNNVELFL